MRSLLPKAGWMLAGVLALYVLSALAGVVTGGPLDPPGAPGPTFVTLDELRTSWHRVLASDDGGDSCNSSRFECVFNGDAVLDNETGLVWERTPAESAQDWQASFSNCNRDASTGGRYGWRLPSFEELASLFDTSADHLPEGHPFNNVLLTVQTFWSVTTAAGDPTGALSFQIDHTIGSSPGNGADKGFEFRAWCVRGGIGHNGP
jgi:hypothetical protein